MKFIITDEIPQRLDSFLSCKLNVSKSQVLQAIKKGLAQCNGKVCLKGGVMLKVGDEVCFDVGGGVSEGDECQNKNQDKQRKQAQNECQNERLGQDRSESRGEKNIESSRHTGGLPNQKNLEKWLGQGEKKPFNQEIEVLFEDDDILVLNKPPHLVIHDAPSVRESTLVDYLKSRGYTLSNLSGEERYGIVHRLDKNTSGAIAIAKSNLAHIALSDQLKSRQMGRYYLAITDMPLKDSMIVEFEMGRNPKNRLKMAKVPNGRYSKSAFIPLLEGRYSLVGAKLYTGRTHQIRVHLESLSRHIIGDELYGKKDTLNMRLMLHAYLLYFIHPRTQKTHLICAPLFEDMLGFLAQNFGREAVDEVVDEGHILRCFGDCF